MRILVVATFFFSVSAWAKPWTNQFIQFELPNNWRCGLEDAEWVCQDDEVTRRKDAVIILLAKRRGPQDTLEGYFARLNQPKVFEASPGQTVRSVKKTARKVKINDQEWVDSLHLESELPGFYTRYLATVHGGPDDGIAVLVTYSINSNRYNQYRSLFESLAQSLKVFNPMGRLNQPVGNQDMFDSVSPKYQTIFPPHGVGGPGETGGDKTDTSATPKSSKASEDETDTLILYLLLAAVLIFVVIKRRRRG